MIWITFFMLSCTFYSEATTDLNSHELRYLADHLTNKECRKLHEALKMRHFDLDHKVTGQKEARVPCIILLQFWDKVEAKKSNFQILALRLKQIGRSDLADFLSKTVMKEKSSAVKRTFLDDPMKDLIAPNSPMLAESPKDAVAYTRIDNRKKPVLWTSMHTLAVIASILSIILILIIILIRCGYIDKWQKKDNEKIKNKEKTVKQKEESESLTAKENEDSDEDMTV